MSLIPAKEACHRYTLPFFVEHSLHGQVQEDCLDILRIRITLHLLPFPPRSKIVTFTNPGPHSRSHCSDFLVVSRFIASAFFRFKKDAPGAHQLWLCGSSWSCINCNVVLHRYSESWEMLTARCSRCHPCTQVRAFVRFGTMLRRALVELVVCQKTRRCRPRSPATTSGFIIQACLKSSFFVKVKTGSEPAILTSLTVRVLVNMSIEILGPLR
jgi:hypothetical protein